MEPAYMFRRTASVELGEIYRTASALSIYFDEMETRPFINRLLSMPAMVNSNIQVEPQQINPNVAVDLREIDLTEQIGKGGFGAVYKGTWRGAPVAVKYAPCNTSNLDDIGQSVREVVLSKKMSHPNVVQTYAWTILTGKEFAESMGGGQLDSENELMVAKRALSVSKPAALAVNIEGLKDLRPSVPKRVGRNSPDAVKGRRSRLSAEGGPGSMDGGTVSQRPSFEQLPEELPEDLSDAEASEVGAIGERSPQRPVAPWLRESITASGPSGSGRPPSYSYPSASLDPGGPPAGIAASPGGVMSNARAAGADICIPIPVVPGLQRANRSSSFSDLEGCNTPMTPGDFSAMEAGGLLSPSPRIHSQPLPPLYRHPSNPAVVTAFSPMPGGGGAGGGRPPQPTGGSFSARAAAGDGAIPSLGLGAGAPRLPAYLALEESEQGGGLPLTSSVLHEAQIRQDRIQPKRQIAFGQSEDAVSREGSQLSASPSPGKAGAGPVGTVRAEPTGMSLLERRGMSHDGGVSTIATEKANINSKSPNMERNVEELQLEGSGLSYNSFNSEEGFGSPMAKRNRSKCNVFEKEELDKLQKGEEHAIMAVVMEFCDLGSLMRAIKKKAFKPHGKWTYHTTYRALLRTAQEIAKGMDYVHSFGIVHGDLKPGNVLLKTHRIDRRGYIAKVSDFGLSRPLMGAERHVSVGDTIGTIAYTAPETLKDNHILKPSDVFAFGVLLWETFYCKSVYEGLEEWQIFHGVSVEGMRPEFDDSCPLPYQKLAQSCWNQDPEKRPTFAEVVVTLTEIEIEFRKECHRQRPHSGAVASPSASRSTSGQLAGALSPQRHLTRFGSSSLPPESSFSKAAAAVPLGVSHLGSGEIVVELSSGGSVVNRAPDVLNTDDILAEIAAKTAGGGAARR